MNKPLRRPCSRCKEMFVPSTKLTKICNSCNKNLRTYYFDERDELCEVQEETRKVKNKTVYKKGGGQRCTNHSQSKN